MDTQEQNVAVETSSAIRGEDACSLENIEDAAVEIRDEDLPGVAEPVQEKLDVLYDQTLTYVRDHPLGALAVAALGGAAIALLVRRNVA